MRLAKGLATIFVIVLVADLALYAANLHTRRRAANLLESLRKLHVGSSTLADAQPVLSVFHTEKIPSGSACPSADVTYGIRVSNNLIDGLGSRFPELLRVGVRPWGVSVTLSFKAGILCAMHYSAGQLLLRHQYAVASPDLESAELVELNAGVTVQEYPDLENYHIRSFQAFLPGFRKSGSHIGIEVTVTPNTTQSEMDHALGFDLSCFSSLRGCRALCQILPLAYKDALHKPSSEHVAELQREEEQIPACQSPQ